MYGDDVDDPVRLLNPETLLVAVNASDELEQRVDVLAHAVRKFNEYGIYDLGARVRKIDREMLSNLVRACERVLAKAREVGA